MKNGWTGGQYSVFRFTFGIYLCVHFAMLLPWGAEVFSNRGVLPDGEASPFLRLFPNLLAIWDSPAFVSFLLGLGVVLSVSFALGFRDRWAALALWYLWACLFGRNPLISNPGLPYVGLLLVVHALLPRAPFGSLDARGRTDPGHGWKLSPHLFRTVWILMAVGYSYSGATKLVSSSWLRGTALSHVLTNPLVRPGGIRRILLELPDVLLRVATYGSLALELGFVFFALSRRLRPFAWGVMLLMHLSLMLLIDFADLSLGMVMLHLFTFDPAWVPGKRANQPETIYYDGTCGLCHRSVRMMLAEDPEGAAFRFAPLEGDAFRRGVSAGRRAEVPDSLIVHTADGTLLTRSTGFAHILIALGGMWGILGRILSRIPRTLRDAVYDTIAAHRKRFFATPAQACPMLPPHLRARFLQ